MSRPSEDGIRSGSFFESGSERAVSTGRGLYKINAPSCFGGFGTKEKTSGLAAAGLFFRLI